MLIFVCRGSVAIYQPEREKEREKDTEEEGNVVVVVQGAASFAFLSSRKKKKRTGHPPDHQEDRRRKKNRETRHTHTHTHRRGSLIIMPVASLGAGAAAPNKELWVPPPSTTTTYLSSTLYKYRYYVMRCPSVRRPIRPARPPTTTLYAYLGFGWPGSHPPLSSSS